MGSVTHIHRLRRVPLHPAPDNDAIVLTGVVLRCTKCGTRWEGRLGPFADEVDTRDVQCPRCTPETPAAA